MFAAKQLVLWEEPTHWKRTWCGKDWRQKGRGWQRMRWLDSITDSMDINLSKRRDIVEDKETWHATVHRVANSQTRLRDWTTTSSINLDFIYWIFCYHFVLHLNDHLKAALQFSPIFGVISLLVQIQNYWFESNNKSHSMLSPSAASNSTNHSQCLNFLISLRILCLLFQWWRCHISPRSSFHAWQWTLALGMWFSIFFLS